MKKRWFLLLMYDTVFFNLLLVTIILLNSIFLTTFDHELETLFSIIQVWLYYAHTRVWPLTQIHTYRKIWEQSKLVFRFAFGYSKYGIINKKINLLFSEKFYRKPWNMPVSNAMQAARWLGLAAGVWYRNFWKHK